ncbi:MAG: hypothetical protein JXK07_14885 [Spirochaetes bacterium]|nr:hypothetical protein [Spirochaetota bacterium]MBN2769941.1 hypothetical protein [Spirochaetota bacterium]
MLVTLSIVTPIDIKFKLKEKVVNVAGTTERGGDALELAPIVFTYPTTHSNRGVCACGYR